MRVITSHISSRAVCGDNGSIVLDTSHTHVNLSAFNCSCVQNNHVPSVVASFLGTFCHHYLTQNTLQLPLAASLGDRALSCVPYSSCGWHPHSPGLFRVKLHFVELLLCQWHNRSRDSHLQRCLHIKCVRRGGCIISCDSSGHGIDG